MNNRISEMERLEIKRLRKIKEKTINRWKESGLLKGLTGHSESEFSKIIEPKKEYLINENENEVDNKC